MFTVKLPGMEEVDTIIVGNGVQFDAQPVLSSKKIKMVLGYLGGLTTINFV